ncbi:hypothetical protein [Austwickia sp. TVS 96-490-7B]|uniref:hypothetical protein n=1 Tax=Austwickia sp. TVS 96-490-7B TaxID=2830843 RepID=UPI001C59CE18|nr:hypothetical protein [Austwickia sp. TVS 96-490-7B]
MTISSSRGTAALTRDTSRYVQVTRLVVQASRTVCQSPGGQMLGAVRRNAAAATGQWSRRAGTSPHGARRTGPPRAEENV